MDVIFQYLLRFEKHYGQMADGSLCVTRAMQHELGQNWGIKATVLYDQPPEFFRPTLLEEKHKVRFMFLSLVPIQISDVRIIFTMCFIHSCFVD
ncbi:hypothetical protein QQP08_000192 [Theobroma cacao]|nr:hypothetical protein QQP08_000192 [Theobroma cacao]